MFKDFELPGSFITIHTTLHVAKAQPACETQVQADVEEKVSSIISTSLKMPNITIDINKLHQIGRTRTEGGKNIVVHSLKQLYEDLKDGKGDT